MRYSPFVFGHHARRPRRAGFGPILAFAFAFGLIFIALSARLDGRELIWGFLVSLERTTVAYALAMVIAVAVALALTAHPLVEALFLPLLDVLQSFPTFALFPVLVSALLFSPETIIVTVLSLEMIWPILFAVVGGVKNRRQDLEEAATIFGARGFKRLIHYTVPQLAPAIMTGSIVGWGEGWEFIIGAELLVSVHSGIGRYLGALGQANQPRRLAFGVVFLMFALFVVNKLVWLPLLARATAYEND